MPPWSLLSLVVPAVHAAPCAAPVRAAAVVASLQDALVAIRIDDEEGLQAAAKALQEGLPCLAEKVPPPLLASAYRVLGLAAFRRGEADEAARWVRSALELDPTFAWGVEELPADDPFRPFFDGERTAADVPPVAVSGRTLQPPDGAQVYLDGRRLSEAAATPDRYHLLQVVSGGVRTELIVGNAFPRDLLGEGGEEEAPAARGRKKRKGRNDRAAETRPEDEEPYPATRITVAKRKRPKAKTPLMLAGGLGLVASGGLYGASFWARARFDEAATEEELLAAASLTNNLLIASGVAAVAGLGIEWWGIALDGGPAWRFWTAPVLGGGVLGGSLRW